MSILSYAESKIFEFNRIAGNFISVDKQKLQNQIKLIKEELRELEEAVETDNCKETLDGINDVLVTALGFAQMLEHQNYDVHGGLSEVAENNLTKFPSTYDIVADTIKWYETEYPDVVLTPSYDQDRSVWVIKDQNGKVRKPINYEGVVLTNYLPKGYDNV